MKLETENLFPRLLRASYFTSYSENFREFRLVPRRCYDYELEFYTASEGGIIVDGDYLEFGAGEINFRKPGQVVCGVFPYNCYILCFSVDFGERDPAGYIFGNPSEAEPAYKNPLLSLLPDKIVPENSRAAEELFREIGKAASLTGDLALFRANALLSNLLLLLFSEQRSREEFSYSRRVIPAAEYIKDNFCEDISVKELIEKSGLSKAYFHKCFKTYAKTTPAALITDLRMERAKTLLQITEDPIGTVAELCGYLDSVYFTHLFKKNVGMTPSKYRQSRRAYS